MSIIRIDEQIRDDLKNLSITRVPLINEFLYERDIMMLTASAGVGKSVIGAQIAISLSSGISLFGGLRTIPSKVYYLQLEGDYEESIERMRLMENDGNGIAISTANLVWHEEKETDLMIEGSANELVSKILLTNFNPHVIIIDPIYKLCSKDICQGDSAIKVVKFSDQLYNQFKCTIILINHTTKSDYIIADGKKVSKDDAFYGHSFLKNHVRTSYYIKKWEGGRIMTKTKGRGSDVLNVIKLHYEPETMTLEMDEGSGDVVDRIKMFAVDLRLRKRKTTFKEVIGEVNCSASYLRQKIKNGEISEIFEIRKTKNRASEWIPKTQK